MSSSLFDELKRLGLPVDGYAVFGSGPLAVRGIIPDCDDLDVLCLSKTWDRVATFAPTRYLPEYDVTIASYLDGRITFGTRWGIGDFDTAELIGSAEIIEALPFVRLEYVIAYKKMRSSERDRAHLAALDRSDYSLS